jgi:DNA polymerase-3 subunit gamma/tau
MNTIAPSEDNAFLSGLDQSVLTDLGGSFSPARLLYCLDELNRSQSQLSRSQNRRIDAEVCLIRLCDEGVSEAPGAVIARLTQLERAVNALSSGLPAKPDFQGPASQAEPTGAAAENKPAKSALISDVPAEPEAGEPVKTRKSADSPADFWPELLSRLKSVVSVPEYTHLTLAEAQFDGHTLTLSMPEEFSYLFLHGRGTEEKVKTEARVLIQKDINAKIIRKSALTTDTKLESWLDRNSSFSNITVED